MSGILNSFVDNAVQCWGCAVFDNLFRVVSNAGAAVYEKIANLCFIIFFALFAFFILWAVWKRINPQKPDTSDPFYLKSVVRVMINSLFALTLLGVGVGFPRFITRITFEPVANITLVYSNAILKTVPEAVNARVTYKPMKMEDTGLYRPKLRDTVISLMKTTVTMFQSFMKLGIAVMEESFAWSKIYSISDIFRHILIFFVGLYLFYGFFKLFIRFCFYFVDVIIAMAMFAFLFPIALMMMSFRGGDMPAWMSTLGKGLGANQIKKLINAIITLGSAVITYMVILVIIARFFSDSGTSVDDLMSAITSGTVMDSDLSESNLATLTLGGTIILVYVLNYIYAQIPQVTKMILNTFGVEEENKLSEQMANDADKLVAIVTSNIKKIGGTIINNGEKKSDDGKSSDKPKDEKKDDKGGDKK
ncbi:MAG: hypothetical protein J5742_03845 [Alphaproteobacteria bacterium]|nr:hypothetical protein [Alphaproteobacteria bacterium]